MNTLLRYSLLAIFVVLCGVANAALEGPDYPAPGGNNWSGSGDGLSGTATWEYTNFNTSGLNSLYFGLNQVQFGPNGAGLSGTVDPFAFSAVSGQSATWTAATTWVNPTTSSVQNATTRLTMTITGLGATPWITDLTSIGLDDTGTFGALGAVVDNSGGLDFTLQWKIEADTGPGWQGINSVQQLPPGGQTVSSFATGFYSEAVPEPSTLIVWALLGTLATGIVSRRTGCPRNN